MRLLYISLTILLTNLISINVHSQSKINKNSISGSFFQLQLNRYSPFVIFDNPLNYSIGYERNLYKNFGFCLSGALKTGRLKQTGFDAGNYGNQIQTNFKIGLLKYFQLSDDIRIVTKLQFYREETEVNNGWRYDRTFPPPFDRRNDWYLNSLYKGIELGYGLDFFVLNRFGIYIQSSIQYGDFTEERFYENYELKGEFNFPIIEELGIKYVF